MRVRQSGKKSFPGGRRSLEDPSHPKPQVSWVKPVDLWKMAGALFLPMSGHPKTATNRKTRTPLSEERNRNRSEQSPQSSRLTAVENCCFKT